MFDYLTTWLTEHPVHVNNTIVAAIILAIFAQAVYIFKNAYWRDAANRVFRQKRAAVCFGILSIFALIGLCDSIQWRPYQVVDGKPMIVDGKPQISPVPISLLDWLDQKTFNLQNKMEKTYSKPMAETLFAMESRLQDDGTEIRIRPPLNHPESHLLGTDMIGRDVLYKSIKGIRTGLIIGGLTTLIAIPFAIFFGMIAGYYGKWVDDIVTYIYTTIASIPRILLIVAFVLIAGQGLLQLSIIMAVTTWVALGRLIRAEVLKLREMEYVQAARAIGASNLRIQVRHILPNVFHLVIIRGVLMFSGLVLAEAVLSYLGVGVGGGTPSWGNMINDGQLELSRDPIVWWNLLGAFIFMFGLLLCTNVFGDALRDALDPRLRDN